jgi:hypothetical protein
VLGKTVIDVFTSVLREKKERKEG